MRVFGVNVKHAWHNPLVDYWFLKPPAVQSPPAPPIWRQSPPRDTPATAQPVPPAVPTVKRQPVAHIRAPRIACYLTHREIWHNIVHSGLRKPALILEHDIKMEADFEGIMRQALQDIPHDWAVLWVGSCSEQANNRTQQVGHRCGCQG